MTTTHLDPPRSSALTAHPDRRLGAVFSVLGGLTLLSSFLVVPGPDVADVHQAGWVPGHLLSAAGFLLLALGLPAIAGSLSGRLGAPGLIGYTAVMVRCVLSTGSHLYSLWVLPTLAPHHELHRQLVDNGKLASIYAGHGDIIHAVLGVAMLGLAYALVRTGRGQRVVAVFLTLAAASEFIGFPFGLALIAATCVWLGVRLLRGGDVLVPLRSS